MDGCPKPATTYGIAIWYAIKLLHNMECHSISESVNICCVNGTAVHLHLGDMSADIDLMAGCSTAYCKDKIRALDPTIRRSFLRSRQLAVPAASGFV